LSSLTRSVSFPPDSPPVYPELCFVSRYNIGVLDVQSAGKEICLGCAKELTEDSPRCFANTCPFVRNQLGSHKGCNYCLQRVTRETHSAREIDLALANMNDPGSRVLLQKCCVLLPNDGHSVCIYCARDKTECSSQGLCRSFSTYRIVLFCCWASEPWWADLCSEQPELSKFSRQTGYPIFFDWATRMTFWVGQQEVRNLTKIMGFFMEQRRAKRSLTS
jgi:hypothetical protein